jgi:prophage antirepressor-like protein
MNGNIIPFNFEGRDIRVVTLNDQVLFIARDVATALGYADPSNAVADHCRHAKSLKDIAFDNSTKGNEINNLPGNTKLIPEGDIYRLVARSKLPSAERFESWVFDEVLPSIRKTGGYQTQTKSELVSTAIVMIGQALGSLELKANHLQEAQDSLDHRTKLLESRINGVELKHRSGVPHGYIAKKHAHHLYGGTLSEEIFHLAMAKLNVEKVEYIHTTDEGYEIPTIAYKADEVPRAVEMFIDNAVQDSPCFCRSPLLKGKRFKYVKEPAIA